MNPLALTTPLFALAGATSLVLLFFFRRGPEGRCPAARVAGLGLLAAAICVALVWSGLDGELRALEGFLLGDGLGCLAALVVLLAGVVTVLLAAPYLRKAGRERAEFYALLLLCVTGMVVMVMTDHLATLFLGLETMSLSLYVLSASLRERQTSVEAGVKYLLTGAFASGILLFGLALIYGATGVMSLSEVATRELADSSLALAGLLLLLVGFGFKVAAVPFHQWAPDVYEGAPTPLTGFMSTAVKLVAMVALIRVVLAFGALGEPLGGVLAWLAVLTLLVGNIGALVQRSVKRLLAYSSVSHAGYLLLGLAALAGAVEVGGRGEAASFAMAALLFYLVTYTLMNLGAFGVLGALETADGDGLSLENLSGLKQRHPVLAGCMLLFMLSLAGVPPTGGFLAKWRLFQTLVDRFEASAQNTWLLLLAFMVLSSVVGLAFYLRVVVAMYMSPAPAQVPVIPRPSPGTLLGVVACAALVLWFGFGPTIFGLGAEALLSWVKEAAG